MSQSSYSTCSTPTGFWTPVGAGLEDALYPIKKVAIIMAEETLQGIPNSHTSLELALATKYEWMDIHMVWGI